ncbi:hypothetical protein CYG49_03855 [Candidatus Saccharibacteria bacterium]|nr:MAG: hypothetical protein CYG49_03855 [Candidatus Saccharibacteria bacterium]
MKKNEIAILILIVSISLAAAYFLGKAIIGEPASKSVKVESVEKITADVKEPSQRVFNNTGINPTIPIVIGNPSNQQPFTDGR